MADLTDWQVLKRFIRDHGAATEPAEFSPAELQRIAMAADRSLKAIVATVAAINRLRGHAPPREGTYEENYGEPEPAA